MYDRRNWSLVLVPNTTKELIRETAKTHNMKLWEVVDRSLQEFTIDIEEET